MEDLREMIEGAVQRGIGALRKEMNAKFEAVEAKIAAFRSEVDARFKALESQITMLRWMIGAVITLQVAVLAALVTLIVLVANMALSENRTSTPLPRSPTVQVPAETMTAPPTGTVPGSEVSAPAAPERPAEQSVSDQPIR